MTPTWLTLKPHTGFFPPLLQRTKRTTYTCLQRHAKIPSTLFYYQWKHLRAHCFSCFAHSFLLVFGRLCHKVEMHRCWAMSSLNSTLVKRTTRSFQMTQLDPFRTTVTGLTCGGLEGARVICLSLRDEAVTRCVYLKTIAANNKARRRGQSELWPEKLSILLVVWMFLCVRVVQAECRLVWLNTACQASAADRAYLNRRSTVCSCSLVRSSLTVALPLFPLALPPFPYSVQTPVNICLLSVTQLSSDFSGWI